MIFQLCICYTFFMKKVLLFDFDGTIADSFENFLEIFAVLANKYHFSLLSREELEKLRSEDARTLIKHLKIPFYKIPFMARDMKKLQLEKIQYIKPFAGLPRVLTQLKEQGYTLAILTSNGKANVQSFLTNNNIDLFTYIHSDSNIFGKDKVINKFLKQNKLQKAEVLYIGDEIRDIQACKKVGVQIASVTWGFNNKEGLTKNNPDFMIDKPEKLSELLKATD